MTESMFDHVLDADGSLSSLERPVHAFAASRAAGGRALAALPSSSLGASPLSFVRAVKTAAMMAAFGSTASFSFDPRLAAALVPQTLEVPAGAPRFRPRSSESGAGSASSQSIARILRELSEAPIEDGVTHRAEDLLSLHIAAFGESALAQAIRSSMSPSVAASLLRLVGRSVLLSEQVRHQLVSWGLACTSVEVRDATVQAVENWQDRALADLLRTYHEPVGWLSDYAANVVRDLDS